MRPTVTTEKKRMRARGGSASALTSANPVFLDGEFIYERGTGKFKIGDGTTAWSGIPYGGGIVGATGPTGPTGPAGADGADGATGPEGPSAAQATTATPDTLAKRDGTGNLTTNVFNAMSANNDYIMVALLGTGGEIGWTHYAGVKMEGRNGVGPFFQLFDDIAANNQTWLISRANRHLTIGPDGTNPSKGVRINRSRADQTAPILAIVDENLAPLSYFDPTGQLMLGAGTPDATLSVNGTASKTGGGSWSSYSDARLKDVEGTFDRGLAELLELQPVLYRFKADNMLGAKSDKVHVGFIAQDVQKAIPEAITESPFTPPAPHAYKREQTYSVCPDTGCQIADAMDPHPVEAAAAVAPVQLLSINQDYLIWTQLNAIKELAARNDELASRVKALEAKLAKKS